MKILLSLFLTLAFSVTALSEEIKPNISNIEIRGDTIIVNDFRTLPYAYAKQLPADLYYWWALAENQRQRQPSPSNFAPTTVIDTYSSGYLPTRRNLGRYQTQERTIFRSYNSRGHSATFYNPYFR